MAKLNETFFYNLEKSVRAYRQYFQFQLKQHGFDITLDQWLTLNMIVEYPAASQIEIAEKVFKDKASVTRIIELLIRDGYLIRGPHPSDARKHNFQLTTYGRESLSRAYEMVPAFRSQALRGIAPVDIQDALTLIIKLGHNCQKYENMKNTKIQIIT